MANEITLKALQDASVDAKSLEEVVNGNDTKQVTTRLGENYPSVKKAIKTLFENGGLPATPFKTKALMTASALADGKYAMVTDETANNGLYVKTSGAWVKSAYDPITAANIYTDNKIGALPQAIDINKKILNLEERTNFVQAEVEGSVGSYDYKNVPNHTWSVDSNNRLIVNNMGAAYPWASLWTMGHQRTTNRNFDLITKFTVTEPVTRVMGLGVFIGKQPVSPYGFLWFSNGSIAIANGSAQVVKLTTGYQPSLMYTQGQQLEMRITIGKDGLGSVLAKNNTTGASYTLDFNLNALGLTLEGNVYLAGFVANATQFNYYNVKYPEVIGGVNNEDIDAIEERVYQLEVAQQSSGISEPKVLITPPDEFLYKDYGFNIYRGLQSHKVFTDFDIKSKKFAATKSIYVDNNTGLDTNSGIETSPYKTFAKAITAANTSGSTCNIFVKSGFYNYLDVGVLPQLTVDTNIVCSDNDPAVLSLTSTESGWAKDATYTNLYKKTVTGTAPIWAFDNGNLDEYGEGRGLLTATTLALANTNLGSIFIDGQTVYVRLLDDRVPDNNVHVIRDLGGLNSGARSIYIENIHILGGNTDTFYMGIAATDKPCYAYKSRFSYGRRQCFRPLRAKGRVYVMDCIASWSKMEDGFSYATPGPVTVDVVEINCIGHHNGLHGGGTSNGSTMHQGGKIIRVNGDYSYNYNRNIADANSGTQSWCVKCISSCATDNTGIVSRSIDYIGVADAGGTSQIWLDDCLTFGSLASYYAGLGTTIYIRNTQYNNLTVTLGEGNIVLY